MKNVISDLEKAISWLSHKYSERSNTMEKRAHQSALEGDFINAERYKTKKVSYEGFVYDLNYSLNIDKLKQTKKRNEEINF